MSPDCLNLVPCIKEVTFLTLTPINEVILSFLTLKVNNEGTGGIILYPIDLKILKEFSFENPPIAIINLSQTIFSLFIIISILFCESIIIFSNLLEHLSIIFNFFELSKRQS